MRMPRPRSAGPGLDIALAVVVAVFGAPMYFGSGLVESPRTGGSGWTEGVFVGVQIGCGLALVLRRRAPYPVTLGCAAATVVALPLALPFACYALTVYERRPTAWRWIPIVVPVAAGSGAAGWRMSGHDPGLTAGATVALLGSAVLAPALLGLYLGSRRRLIQALAERAERAEADQELRAEQARSAERSRLAGEMHDVVTHRVSLMVLQANSLRTRLADPELRDAAQEMVEVGRGTLRELRELVGILRSEQHLGTAAQTAKPAILDVSELIAQSAAAGVSIELVTEGEPVAAEPAVARTGFRVVQEALTNTHKHAPGGRVRVELRYDPGLVHVCVRNTAGDPVAPADSAGTGLIGLRERVDLVGGTLRAGPCPDGGFELAAELPLGAAGSAGSSLGRPVPSGSVGSARSVAPVDSAGSADSADSFGSADSAGSAGSVDSVGSAGSADSVRSPGSAGSVGKDAR
ncbi:sensor histidine kinase [Embleya sp. AB8]|uniref:sensor histidine kinase n=1 Tax=Embleya sp. AB8 TaxID=3156304 RepID=UPI003C787DE8